MEIVENFFNKVAKSLDEKYFPNVVYYRDNKNCTNVHYSLELFNNGVITYNQLIGRLAKNCNDTKENIKKIVDLFIN